MVELKTLEEASTFGQQFIGKTKDLFPRMLSLYFRFFKDISFCQRWDEG